MSQKDTKQTQIMTVADLQKILAKLTKEGSDDFKIWLPCDEEGYPC